MESLEKDWTEYPVLHFDLSVLKNCDHTELTGKLGILLSQYEKAFNIENHWNTPGSRLSQLIVQAECMTGKKAVIIIDEYDAPLLDNLHDESKLETVRTIMQEFFAPIKANDAHIHFAFITGVTRFSQLSIFSSVNNLANISMEPEFATICGITEDELTTTMKEDIEHLAAQNNVTATDMENMLKESYDGYHFSKNSPDIFNPFSLMQAFASGEIDNYWYESGTSTFLIRQLRRFKTDVTKLDEVFTFASAFNRPTEQMNDALPLLYQSGYLTIKKYDPKTKAYYLGIPNKEVRSGLMENLLPDYTNIGDGESLGFAAKFYNALLAYDIDQAMKLMQSYFASIPYPEGGKEVLADMQKSEYYYETLFYIILSLMNFTVLTQVKSCRGRADAVMFTKDSIFVFEIKINKPAKEALDQIDDKGYMVPFKADGRTLVKVGISFSTNTRTIEDWAYNVTDPTRF